MIHYLTGNIFESDAMALVNTVNLMGVMGKGVALQFRQKFPDNYKVYKSACKDDRSIDIGKLLVCKEQTVFGEKLIVNFPTKTDWRKPSEYIYIEKGLDDLVRVISRYKITSIAIPPLGSGNGGLYWPKVKEILERKLTSLDIDVFIYEPTARIKEQMKAERVKLTNGRALLLYVLFDLVRHGEFVSEFSSEKICYFLQKFGAKDILKLTYEPKYYGPYSGKVRYVLNALNGSYIMGYSDMDRKPFEAIFLVPDTYQDVEKVILDNSQLLDIANKTKSFLEGFYSDFGLELLSSVDYLLSVFGNEMTNEQIYAQMEKWSDRKARLFADIRYIDIARRHILTR
jgi:O-acetyl-ADP-ribose deacetylase (regulator of RNase III)